MAIAYIVCLPGNIFGRYILQLLTKFAKLYIFSNFSAKSCKQIVLWKPPSPEVASILSGKTLQVFSLLLTLKSCSCFKCNCLFTNITCIGFQPIGRRLTWMLLTWVCRGGRLKVASRTLQSLLCESELNNEAVRTCPANNVNRF